MLNKIKEICAAQRCCCNCIMLDDQRQCLVTWPNPDAWEVELIEKLVKEYEDARIIQE